MKTYTHPNVPDNPIQDEDSLPEYTGQAEGKDMNKPVQEPQGSKIKGRFIEMTGRRFGYLTAVSLAPRLKGEISWRCLCDCGNTHVVTGQLLRRGGVRSCGCKRYGQAKTHGARHTSEWVIWSSMRGRCNNPNDKAYARYGGRGIFVCGEWEAFEKFLSDMGPRPSKKHSLDRIDNNGGYSKENCRWATNKEQNRNKRNNVLLTHNGETKTLVEWDEASGAARGSIASRIYKGWSVERALSTPINPIKRRRAVA